MTKNSLFSQIVLFLNSGAALLLLVSCVTHYVTLSMLPVLPYLSLVVPILVFINLLFVLFWLFFRIRYMLLSGFALLVALLFHGIFYEIRFRHKSVRPDDMSVLTFNARGFDPYHQLKSDRVADDILDFIKTQDPDLLCFQEFDYTQTKKFTQYPFHFFNYIYDTEPHVPQAIFSKFPIVAKGSLEFPNSKNNAIYADIVYHKDTIRVYNIHLQSYQFVPKRGHLKELATPGFYERLNYTFHKQQQQAELVADHMAATRYPILVCGDFNNTQFSNVYRTIKGDLNDSFRERGAGYGRTFNFKYYPLRIDFILADPKFEVRSHTNFNVVLSDHFPVKATLRLEEKP